MKIERLEDRKCFTITDDSRDDDYANIEFFVITNKDNKQDIYVSKWPIEGICEFVYSTVSPTVSETMESLLQWLKRDNNYEKLTEKYGNYEKSSILSDLYSCYDNTYATSLTFVDTDTLSTYIIDDSYIIEIYDDNGAVCPIIFVSSFSNLCLKYAIYLDDTKLNKIVDWFYDDMPNVATLTYRQSVEHDFRVCIKEYNKAMAELNKD